MSRREEASPDPRQKGVRAASSALRALPPQQPEPAPRGPTLGDGEVEALFREFAPKVYALARRFGLDNEEAEDGVQEVFLKVQRRISTFRGEAALSTWLYQVAVNALRDHRRKLLRHRRTLTLQAPRNAEDGGEPVEQRLASPIGTPLEAAARSERGRIVRESLDRLPARFREVLILRELEGWSYRDIARVLGLAQGTVESRIFRARARLTAELRRREESL